MKLRVSEIFASIQGETTAAGFPSLFIRLAGCNLRCSFCDTAYSWEDGIQMSVEEIMCKALSFTWVHHVTLTGGEPLFQNETPALARRLLDAGFRVRVETNGSFPLDLLPDGCERMVDIKPPSSGEQKSFYRRNLQLLTERDEVKLLAADEADLAFAFGLCRSELAKAPCVINISPVTGFLDAGALAQRIIDEKLNIRLNLQLHKIIWPEGEPR